MRSRVPWTVYRKRRDSEEPKKEKELVCWTCGSLPHRVEGTICKDCGLAFAEEVIEREESSLRSVAGRMEDEY